MCIFPSLVSCHRQTRLFTFSLHVLSYLSHFLFNGWRIDVETASQFQLAASQVGLPRGLVGGRDWKHFVTYLPVSSTTVANMNSVDLSFTMTWQSSISGEMAFSSSSSFEPLAVLVAGSSGMMRLACRLLSSAVSARRRVCAMFSMTLPPVNSDRCGLRAARCLRARLRSAWMGESVRGRMIMIGEKNVSRRRGKSDCDCLLNSLPPSAALAVFSQPNLLQLQLNRCDGGN